MGQLNQLGLHGRRRPRDKWRSADVGFYVLNAPVNVTKQE